MRNDLSAVKEMLETKAQEAAEVVVEEVEEVEQSTETVEEVEITNEEENENTEEAEETELLEEEAEEPEGYTMKSLAEAIEIEQSELYDTMIPLRDGDPISISEMKNQYQDMVKEKAGFESQIEELKQASSQVPQQAQLSQAEFQAQVEMSRVQEEYNNTDWKDLEEYDPGNAALKKQQFQERFNAAQYTMNQAGHQRQQDHQRLLTEQHAKMLEIVPTWQDKAVMDSDFGKIKTIMLDAGYTQEIVESNTDPISLKLLHELMTLRAEKTKSVAMVKQVKRAPKALNAKKVVPVTKREAVTKAVSKAKQSGNKHDALAAVKALMSQG